MLITFQCPEEFGKVEPLQSLVKIHLQTLSVYVVLAISSAVQVGIIPQEEKENSTEGVSATKGIAHRYASLLKTKEKHRQKFCLGFS